MKRISLSLLLIFALAFGAANAQESTETPETCPSGQTFEAERGACVESGSIEMSIATPLWVREYVVANEIVSAYVAQQRVTFLTGVFALPPDRPLDFTLDYEESRYDNRLASVLFRVNYDLAADVSLSEIRSFTFDLGTGTPVPLADLLLPNANPVSTFGPLVPPEAVEAGFVSLISGGLDDPALFENYTLSDEGITFHYPPLPQAGVSAGEFSVFLPMEIAGPVLILPDPLPESTEAPE